MADFEICKTNKEAIAGEVRQYLQGMLDAIEDGTIDDNLDFEHYAVRTQEVPFAIGPIDHLSHTLDDGNDTGEELPGLCATHLATWNGFDERAEHALKMHFGYGTVNCGGYPGSHVALIGCNDCRWGDDEDEIVMEDPVVLKVFA